jgi:hypothetical protein
VAAPQDVEAKRLLRFRTDDLTVGDVKTGERVNLLLAPTGAGRTLSPQAIEAILVAHPEDGGDGPVWVAIADADRDALLGRLGRSRLIIAPAG